MLTILYLLVKTKTSIMAVAQTYDFTSGMTIPHLNHWNYAHTDVKFH